MDPKWSFYVYMAADNNLSRIAQADLAEMSKADPGVVNVVVQLDVPNADTQRLVLDSAGFQRVASADLVGNANAGDAKVLTAFLKAGKELRKADRTAVIFPTHGMGFVDFTFEKLGGIVTSSRTVMKAFSRSATSIFKSTIVVTALQFESLAMDDSAQDFLDNQELESGLKNALGRNETFDILGCDACLMAMVEVAHQVRDCGTYFVASQDDEQPAGWPYDKVLQQFRADTTAVDGAKAIVEQYAVATALDDKATLSAVDLGRMNALAAVLDGLGGALLAMVPKQMNALAQARQDARTMADYDYIDLSGFVKAIKIRLGLSLGSLSSLPTSGAGSDPLDAITIAADAVLDETQRAVVATSKEPAKSGACGLSIYVPNAPVTPEYHRLSLSEAAPRWHDFIVAYGQNR